jgi:hypothetical protein
MSSIEEVEVSNNKKCNVCLETKDKSDFYRNRAKCKKCYLKQDLANKKINHHCDICNCDLHKQNLKIHLNSKKHNKNVNKSMLNKNVSKFMLNELGDLII